MTDDDLDQVKQYISQGKTIQQALKTCGIHWRQYYVRTSTEQRAAVKALRQTCKPCLREKIELRAVVSERRWQQVNDLCLRRGITVSRLLNSLVAKELLADAVD